MRRLLRWYGANPLHLLALLGCFALAGYAAIQLVSNRPLAVAVWFAGAVVGHDLLLVPLYTLADRSVMSALRHRAPRLPVIPWINYLRVPAGLSLLLLLVWFPLIFRLTRHYQFSTTLSPNPFLWHWLGVTGALFLLSAAAFALRLRAAHRARGHESGSTPGSAAVPGPAAAPSRDHPPSAGQRAQEPAPPRAIPPPPDTGPNKDRTGELSGRWPPSLQIHPAQVLAQAPSELRRPNRLSRLRM
jgi:hypothetical protein